jgi:hypothetical protein
VTNPTIDELWRRLDADRPPPVDPAVRRARRRRRLIRRWRRRLAIALTVLAAALLVLTVVAAFQARSHLLAARDGLERGRSALLSGDVNAAAAAFTTAGQRFAAARRWTTNPPMRLVGSLPVVGRSVRAGDALAEAGGLLADAGKELVAVSLDLPDGPATLAPSEGVIPVASLRAVAPALAAAHRQVAEASAVVAAAPTRGLAPPVANARAELATQVADLDQALGVAAPLAEALPGFLGADGPRRYFVGAANLAELRGTGGFIGAFAVLTADRGRIDLGEFNSVVRLQSAREPSDVAALEPSFAARYDRFGGAGFWQNINMTPDLPTAAQAMVGLYEHDTGERLDGVIVVDPYALQALLRVTGATEVPDVGMVGAGDVVEVVSVASYALLPGTDRKPVLGEVAAAALDRFLHRPGTADLAAGARALADAAGGGHLLLHATDPDVQDAFDATGLGGRLGGDGDFLAFVGNNAAANKADFYMERAVRYEVWLDDDGSGWATATVELANHTPTSGMPVDVIGPNRNVPGLEAGDNLTYMSAYCAPGCELWDSDHDRLYGETEIGEELGLPVFSTWQWVPSGESRAITHTFRLAEAWEPADGAGRYRLVFHNQPTARPTTLEVVVHPPPGARITDAGDRMVLSGGAAAWAGQPGRAAGFDVEFTPLSSNPVLRHLQESYGWWKERVGG